jgi:hypothetical protein
MADDARADSILGMHHSTFRLGHELPGEPMRRLLTVAGRDAGRIVARDIGGVWTNGDAAR